MRGQLLFASVLLVLLAALAGAYLFDGLLAWTSGLLYIAYDTALILFVARRTRRLGAPATGAASGPALGVIVPARNEAEVLPACLDALLPQLRAGDALIVVDDGSTDTTRKLLAEHYGIAAGAPGQLWTSEKHAGLRLLSKSHEGKAIALNAGCALHEAEVLVTIDADTCVEPGALDALRQAFAGSPDLAAAGGALLPVCRPGSWSRALQGFQFFEYLRAYLSREAWAQSNALLLVSGAFAAYRRSAFAAIGGFRPDCMVEDYELIHRLHHHSLERDLGWQVSVVAGARARTDAPATPGAFLSQRRRWFAGFLETHYRYRAMTGNARFGAVGRLMLPVKTVDTLQPLYGLLAVALLLVFVLGGGAPARAVLAVLLAKLLFDLGYHLWALRRYHQWTGQALPAALWPQAALAALAEPFSFQLLRHLGAALGWGDLLLGRRRWRAQRRLNSAIPEA